MKLEIKTFKIVESMRDAWEAQSPLPILQLDCSMLEWCHNRCLWWCRGNKCTKMNVWLTPNLSFNIYMANLQAKHYLPCITCYNHLNYTIELLDLSKCEPKNLFKDNYSMFAFLMHAHFKISLKWGENIKEYDHGNTWH